MMNSAGAALAGSCKAALPASDGGTGGDGRASAGTQLVGSAIKPTRAVTAWSISAPVMHTVVATVGAHSVNVPVGFRKATCKYTAQSSLTLFFISRL